MIPNIKGVYRKKQELPKIPNLTQGVDSILKATADLTNTKNEVVKKVNEKITEIDTKLAKVEENTSFVEKRATEAIKAIKDTKDEAIEAIKDIKQGEPGKDGISPEPIDKDEIIEAVLKEIPEPQIIDEKKLRNSILKSLPEKKGSLKIITEKVETDPMSVIEEILKLPPDKFKLRLDQIDGLDQTINAFRNQIARKGYLHGGGDTLVAGSGISLTSNANGTKIISAPGSTTDEKVKITNADTTPNYLENKLLAGTGITVTKENAGGNEDLKVSLTTANGYLSTIFTSQTSINVVHNFGKSPHVQVWEFISGTIYKVIQPIDITENSLNDFTVTFTSSTTGKIISQI